MLICAQSGRVSGPEKKTNPASSARSDKKGLKDNNNRLLGIGNKLCISFGTKIKIPICGGLESDYTEMTLHRFVIFRVKHRNLDSEQTRRDIIIILLLIKQPIKILLYRFSVKNTVSRPVFRVKFAIFEISIFFGTEKSATLVSYIVTVLV